MARSISVPPAQDPNSVWAYGKVEKGWYMAKSVRSKEYADHLESMGYVVCMATTKPTAISATA